MPFNNNSIYSVNFSALTTMLTPPLLRNSNMDAWTTAQSAEIQIDNILFTQYITGSTYPIFSASTTYIPGNRVVASPNGFNNEIFENLTGSTFTALTDTNTWLPVNPSFIGAEERSLYNSQKIILEYALNRQFQILSQINNPTTWTGANHTDQIYIGTNNVTSTRFIISLTETYSSNLTNTGYLVITNGGQWLGNSYTPAPQTEFTVWVPNISIPAYTGISLSVVSGFTENYVIAGVTFSVSGY